jgi:hypothetical protein
MNVTVYPTKASALRIRHPSHGPLRAGQGTSWIKDGFTSRMLSDGLVTEDPGAAYLGPPNPLPLRKFRDAPATSPRGRVARRR